MNKLVLHIGSFKTGTTSIQNTFYNNSKELLRHTIVYPGNSKNHRWLAYWDDGTRLSNENNTTKKEALKYINNGKAYLSGLVEKNRNKVFFISSEFLFTTPVNELFLMKQFLNNLFNEVVILVYVRNPADMLTSWVSESVKNGEHTLKSGMEKIKPYVALKYLYNYKKVFSSDAMIVRRYGREYFLNQDLFDDLFISSLGKVINIKKHTSNVSLTIEALQVAEYVNTNFPRNSENRGFINYLYGIRGQKFKVPKKYIRLIDDESKPYLDKLNKEFGIVFNQTDLSQYPEMIDSKFEPDVINSIAMQLNNLSLTKNEYWTVVECVSLLKNIDEDLSNKLKKIAMKSNSDAIL